MTENASLQILFKCPTPAIAFWKCYKTLTFCSLLRRCTIPCACHAKRDLNVQKWSVRGVLCTFFPTTLCGVLVFDSVSRVLRPPPPPANLLQHTSLSHIIFHTTHLSHTSSSTTILSTTIFVTHLTHIFVHHSSVSTTIFVTHLTHISHIPHTSHTHPTIFVTHLCDAAALCVAWRSVPFAWQAWHLETFTCDLRGRRGTVDTGLGLVARLDRIGRAVTQRHFAWQARHSATSTSHLRGKRGTWRHQTSICVAGVALETLGMVWWRAWTGLVAR